MRRFPKLHHEQRSDERYRRLVLVFCFGPLLSCAPSEFDKFTSGTARDPSTCGATRCEDAGAKERDASEEDDADGAVDDAGTQAPPLDGSAEDVSPPPIEAGLQDATDDAAVDRMDGDVQDAPTDAPSTPPDIGPCDGGLPACEPNRVEPGMGACGLCDSGVHRRTRACAADGCSWKAWSAWSDCEGEHVECDPTAPSPPQAVACTTCGTRNQSRSCSPATCTWGPWMDISACTWCNECSEVVYCDTPSDIANRGTWCRQKACSRPQALGNCMEDAQRVCGGITQPFFMEYL